MIQQQDVFYFGKTHKTHGINGELQLSFNTDIFENIDELFFILEIENILVPFYVEDFRYKNNETLLVKFEGINSAEEAHKYENVNVYLPAKYKGEEKTTDDLTYFIGFTIQEKDAIIGNIVDINDQTINLLFCVKNENGNEFLIPIAEEFITDINHKKKIIKVQLPEGLLDIDNIKE